MIESSNKQNTDINIIVSGESYGRVLIHFFDVSLHYSLHTRAVTINKTDQEKNRHRIRR